MPPEFSLWSLLFFSFFLFFSFPHINQFQWGVSEELEASYCVSLKRDEGRWREGGREGGRKAGEQSQRDAIRSKPWVMA